MAKEKHVAQATNFRGIVLTHRQFTFTNELEGFEKLEQWFNGLQKKHRLNQLIIGMEPTGHYWFNLANWHESYLASFIMERVFLLAKLPFYFSLEFAWYPTLKLDPKSIKYQRFHFYIVLDES